VVIYGGLPPKRAHNGVGAGSNPAGPTSIR
jgi:hypothetical protein